MYYILRKHSSVNHAVTHNSTIICVSVCQFQFEFTAVLDRIFNCNAIVMFHLIANDTFIQGCVASRSNWC